MCIQWNLDLTKCQGSREIGLLKVGIITKFCSIHFERLGWRISFVIPRTLLYRGSLKIKVPLYLYNFDTYITSHIYIKNTQILSGLNNKTVEPLPIAILSTMAMFCCPHLLFIHTSSDKKNFP